MGGDVERSVILTGFMGTGKTTVGRIVAQRLGLTFVDTDEMIEERFGAITEIFAEQGAAAFREMERDVARELSGRSGLVIATGGRLMLDQQCASCLEPLGDVVCLTAEPEVILERISGTSRRPLLDVADPPARVRELLDGRADAYGRFKAVQTDGRSPDEVADAVLLVLGHPSSEAP